MVKRLPPESSIQVVSYKLARAAGACHLPLHGSNHELLQLLAFDTPERAKGGEQALCPLGRSAGQAFRWLEILGS